MHFSWRMLLLTFVITLLIFTMPLSFEINSTNSEAGLYNIHCTHNYYSNGTFHLINEDLNITYDIINGSITNFDTHKSNEYLTMSVQNSSNAILTLNMPKTFLDISSGHLSFSAETNQYKDALYLNVVHVNADSNLTHNILHMNLPSGNYQMWIAAGGTPEAGAEYMKNCVIVPEFGSLALMIVSIGIVGVILIQRRFRLYSSTEGTAR